MPNETTDIKVELATLKQELENVNSIQGRLDTAIDKLTDIQSGVKSMLAVHEARIERAEESDVEIQSIMENRQEAIREDIQTLHGRITDESKELRSYFTEKLQQLEKTKWIMVGVACALGISFSPMANMLTSLI